jgi:hypothetical protein
MDQSRRKARLEDFLGRLQSGLAVSNRELKTWLGEQAFSEYTSECARQSELRKELRDKPSAVKEYDWRLKRALFVYNKAEGAAAKGKRDAAKRFHAQAEQLFEHALEYLQEVIGSNPSLCVWFDRDTEWSVDGDAGIDPIAIPRVVTSRSLDNRGGGILVMVLSKTDIKIAAVERALAEIADDASEAIEPEQDQSNQRLKGFLKASIDNL